MRIVSAGFPLVYFERGDQRSSGEPAVWHQSKAIYNDMIN